MKNSRSLMSLTLGAVAVTLAFAGCANSNGSTADNEDKTKCLAPKAGEVTSVNKVCVIMNDEPVDPSVASAEWKGEKVGFCCAGCAPKWAKMTPAQKDAALAAAKNTK
jgi:hypothetical protein